VSLISAKRKCRVQRSPGSLPAQRPHRYGKNGRRIVSAFIATAFTRATSAAASTQWRKVADQLHPKLPKLAALMDGSEPDVLAYMSSPATHRAKLHSTDEIDKRILRQRAVFGARERPRGEERRVGCKRRQASNSFLAELRRSRASPFCGGFPVIDEARVVALNLQGQR
jgi:hypothetical protein